MLPLTGAAQQQTFHMGIRMGLHPGSSFRSEYEGIESVQKSIYDFGLQFRIGGRLYGATGISCFVSQHSFTLADSSCELKQDHLGIPLRIGFQAAKGKNWNWRIETGMEYRSCLLVSPNEWNLNRKSRELNRNHLDFVALTGADWGKFSFNLSYRRVFTGTLRHAPQSDDQLWLSIGFFFK